MGLILDTSVLVAAERGRFDLASFLSARPAEDTALAVIPASELLQGIERAELPAVRERRAAFVEQVLSDFPTLPFTLATVHIHARIWADLERRGTPVGSHDLLIATTGLEAGYAVATLNRREFERVSDLVLIPVDEYLQT